MATSQEQYNEFGRDPEKWEVCAIKWIFENPDFRYELVGGIEIKDPAQEHEKSEALDRVEAPDLEAAVAAAHAMLDKHAREGGDLGFEIWLAPPKHPYPGQEELGVPHYRLAAEARKQARAIGIRGGDLEARIARIVRHAAPFDHKIANLRYRGVIMRVEDDRVTWLDLAVPPRRPGRPSTRKTKGQFGPAGLCARRPTSCLTDLEAPTRVPRRAINCTSRFCRTHGLARLSDAQARPNPWVRS